MPLPATVETLDDLPEPVRAFYLETENGRWRLDAEGVEDVSGLKSALEKERAQRKTLKAALAEREAMSGDGGDPMSPEETDTLPADPMTEPVESTAPEPDRASVLAARLIDSEARSAIRAAQGVPELLLPIVTARLSVDPEGLIVALDDDGAATDVARIVDALRADPIYGRAFQASGKGGSGAPIGGRCEAEPVTVSAADPQAVARHISDIASGRMRLA